MLCEDQFQPDPTPGNTLTSESCPHIQNINKVNEIYFFFVLKHGLQRLTLELYWHDDIGIHGVHSHICAVVVSSFLLEQR